MKKLIKYICAASVAVSALASCTDLNDEVYSEITADSFAGQEGGLSVILALPYNNLQTSVLAQNQFVFEEQAADLMVLPIRNITGEWAGSAKYAEAYNFTWSATTVGIIGWWNTLFSAVTSANAAMVQLEMMRGTIDDAELDSAIAEMKMLRAFAYFRILERWGDVPLILDNNTTNEELVTTKSDVIYKYMINEIDECLPYLSKDKSSHYGRIHYYAALAIKVKYLITAAVFLDTSRNDAVYPYETEGLDECIAACDELIRDGGYILEPDYFTNFLYKNEMSRENIFVYPTDPANKINGVGFAYARNLMHKSEQVRYDADGVAYNGWCATPVLYHLFNESDKRREGLNVGPQEFNGVPLLCIKAQNKNPETGLYRQLDFKADWDIKNCDEDSGARITKFEFVKGMDVRATDNDFAIIRYSDILLMKAEAIMRKNGGVATTEAVDLINEVHNRAFTGTDNLDYYTTSNLTMEALLDERGREFYGEFLRGPDLIRFHKFFNNAGTEFYGRAENTKTEYFRTVLPIPQAYLNVAPNVSQNTGYFTE